jgi:hypothetical protein
VAAAALLSLGLAQRPATAQPQRPAASTSDEWAYSIELGDTLIGLHARLMRPDADWRIVQRLNRIADPRLLRPGSTLRIPVALLREEGAGAEVLHVHGEVWLERAGSARRALDSAELLQVGDTVGTGAQSSLALRFADGARVLVGPAARLVVDRHAKLGASGRVETRVKLDGGSAEVHVPPGAAASTAPGSQANLPPAARSATPQRATPRFELRTPVVNLGVRGTDFRARIDGERTLAEVLQGQVAAGAQPIGAGFGTVATAGAVTPPRALLPAPDLSEVPTRIDRLPLQLALGRIDAAAGATAFRAQVFDTTEPPRLRLEGRFDTPLAAWPDDLPDGRYELRVRAADAQGIEGRSARLVFTLKARPEPPFPLRPRAGERLTDEEITLAWARNPQAARYRLQVAPSADFAAPSVSRDDLTGTELSLRLPLGVHHWRVASVRADGDLGPWGDAQTLERAERPPPPPPGAPATQAPQASDGSIVVRWAASPLPGASYQVQVAHDAEFTRIVADERLTNTEYTLADPGPGTYYVRVRSVAADGRAGAFGGAQVVEVPRSMWWLWLLPLLLLF